MKLSLTKFNIATFIALLFHVSGCIGMFTSHKDWFIQNTVLNLLLMFALILWTQKEKNVGFFFFFLLAFGVGMMVEMIGTNTGFLFGDYLYGVVLGPTINNVPWLIGINWFIVLYCSGVVVALFHNTLEAKYERTGQKLPKPIMFASLVFDAAFLTTFFDWMMEPVAVKLGFWTWLGNGEIPLLNYACWFFISAVLLAVFKLLRFDKQNHFAVHLLIIQLLFFGVLRTFL